MVRPVASTISSDSEEENVRNLEIALQSVNIQSPQTPDVTSDITNETSLETVHSQDETSLNIINHVEGEEEEGAVGFASISESEVSQTTSDNSTTLSTPKSFQSSQNLITRKLDHRSLSTNLVESSSSASESLRRHSLNENILDGNSSEITSLPAQTSHLENTMNGHTCCNSRISSNERETPQVMNEGATLYREFLREEFRRRNIREPPCLNSPPLTSRIRTTAMPSDVIRAGNQLRSMSDQFAQSPMRQWVQQQADNVSLQNLDFNSFSDLLYGLFQEGGVTWERVLVLFFFCADVSVRAFREKLETQFHDIVNWSLQFISGKRFSQWIQNNGGWARVLQNSVDHAYKLAMIGFCAMGMLAFAAYIWKNK